MKRQEEQELEDLIDMFLTKGWKIFMQDFNKLLTDKIQSADLNCKTNDEWQYNRGVVSELRYITNYEQIMKSRLEGSDAQIF